MMTPGTDGERRVPGGPLPGWPPRADRGSLGDLEALVLGVVGDALLPLVQRASDVSLVGERLADRLVPVVDGLVEERRPLEAQVHGVADVGEDLVHRLAAVERGLL